MSYGLPARLLDENRRRWLAEGGVENKAAQAWIERIIFLMLGSFDSFGIPKTLGGLFANIFRQSRKKQPVSETVVAEYINPENELRILLWLNHGCKISNLYGDDGEMQCGFCNIDFNRMTVDQIKHQLSNIRSTYGTINKEPVPEAVEEIVTFDLPMCPVCKSNMVVVKYRDGEYFWKCLCTFSTLSQIEKSGIDKKLYEIQHEAVEPFSIWDNEKDAEYDTMEPDPIMPVCPFITDK